MAPAASTSSSASTSAHNQWEHLTFVEVLEDLSSRFIVNLPKEELQSIQRICFQVEQAHWFYEDFLRPMNASLPSLNLRRFSIYILQTASLEVPLIRQYVSSDQSQDDSNRVQDWQALGQASYGLEAAFDEFLKYKTRVPVCGVILVSEDWKSVSVPEHRHRCPDGTNLNLFSAPPHTVSPRQGLEVIRCVGISQRQDQSIRISSGLRRQRDL